MPHLHFKCISENHVKSLSQTLPKELATAMETSEDNFSFESVPHKFFSAGKVTESYPYVEVHWFERSQDCKIKSAKIITDQVRKLTSAEDVVVVYVPLAKNDYFENGKSF